MTDNIREIGKVVNYYGGVVIKEEDGRYYWTVENWDGFRWEDISESLYRALSDHQDALDAAKEKRNERLPH